MTRPVVTAAPNSVFLRHQGQVIELTPPEARLVAQELFDASNRAAVNAYDGCHLAAVIRSWRRPLA